MEHKRCEESRQSALDFKCKKILPGMEKSSISDLVAIQIVNVDEISDMESNLASQTPEKTIQPPRSKNKGSKLPIRALGNFFEDFQNADVGTQAAHENPKDNNDKDVSISESIPNVVWDLQKHEENELPNKYEIIADFFDRMETSARLLSLCNKLPSFQNICVQVEILTKRKFLYTHLAQIKHIFPEAIQIEKILTHDESTLCMKPDMKITLLADVLEGHLDQSPSMSLRKAFRARLLEFFSKHPEGGDIPEALLPEPFNQRNHTILPELLPVGLSTKLHQPTFVGSEHLSNSSHLSTNFCRLFSQKIVPETEKTPLLASPVPITSVTTASENLQCIESPVKKEVFSAASASASASIKSPAELIFSPGHSNSHFSGSTPSKLVSTPEKLMTETPAQPTPIRSVPTPDDNVTTETVILSHSARRRALIFSSPSKSERSESSDSKTMVGATEQNRATSSFRPEAVTMKASHMEEGSSAMLQQMVEENVSVTATDCKISRTGFAKRQHTLSCLPGLFNTVCRIFRSANCSSITKQELVHKILLHNCDIIETGEVEEQLKLLEELVPDWICGKMVSSGDFLYCIRKFSDPNSILARLVEAV
ncbi:CDT1-like protein a, chloroplastic [Magnolia sinica]|uniref:CDT1-like protein a, chloroplastic n=1 Tax=Magnolia sinica TaxID=86752 RepID=UPI0026585588|nr:CDT1-like protein a, chloroplastic [Magnolia sinica]